MRNLYHSLRGSGITASLFCASLLAGCLVGGTEDTPVAGSVRPGLYRIDYTPHFPAYGVPHADSFGVVTNLLLDSSGQYRLFLVDTFYAGAVPLVVYAGQWSSGPASLVQSARLYGAAYPNDFSYPGIFYYSPVFTDSAPVRAAAPGFFQRYEDDFISGSNLWMTYRALAAPVPLTGRYTLQDTLLGVNAAPLTRREELDFNRGGSFRSREYYDGELAVETLADRWLQPGDYVFAVNPRRRYFDTAGVATPWDTLPGDWVLTLRAIGTGAFERLDVFDWYDEYAWVTYRKDATLKMAAEAGVAATGTGLGKGSATPRRPARFVSGAPRWTRSAVQSGDAHASRIPHRARTDLRSSRADGLPPRAPAR
jgi:hypothetical protein